MGEREGRRVGGRASEDKPPAWVPGSSHAGLLHPSSPQSTAPQLNHPLPLSVGNFLIPCSFWMGLLVSLVSASPRLSPSKGGGPSRQPHHHRESSSQAQAERASGRLCPCSV